MSSLLDEVDFVINWADELSAGAQIGLCIGLTLGLLVLLKFVILKRIGLFVNKTEVGWDNDLFVPISKRTEVFTMVFCVNLSLSWLSPETLLQVNYLLNIAYIVLMTSIISSTIKVVVPPMMAYIQSNESGVSVTGRNVFLSGLMRSLAWTVAIFLIVNEFGIELSGIFASFAVFSLIAGLALQQSLGNILNSFMLAMDRPFDVGDRIEVNGIEGKVISSGILSTKLLTWSEELVIIPNNSLVSNTVLNKARGGGDGVPKRLNLLVDIGVDYSEDPPHIKKILIEVAKSCPYTLEDPSPRALLIRLGEYSRDFRLYTWISDYSDEWPARDWILQAISDRFDEEDIIIPFPVSIEMKAQPSYKGANRELRVRRKEARQHAARLQMARADQVHREERDTVRSEIAWLEQQLLDTSLQSREKEKIRAEIAALASTLDMFDGD
ncbi:MAG: hypothetical protein CMB37_03730 [Euryarchaeota archaeon]|nr:hypothetical protein [Euryarchaeota archaeon]